MSADRVGVAVGEEDVGRSDGAAVGDEDVGRSDGAAVLVFSAGADVARVGADELGEPDAVGVRDAEAEAEADAEVDSGDTDADGDPCVPLRLAEGVPRSEPAGLGE